MMQDHLMKWPRSWDSPALVRKRSDKFFPSKVYYLEKENVDSLGKNAADMIYEQLEKWRTVLIPVIGI